MSAARRFLPSNPADLARAIVPIGLLALAAILPNLRLPVLALAVIGTVIAIGRNAPVRWAWAAAVPVALSLAWEGWPAPIPAAGGLDCADPGSPIAIWRAAQAAIVLGALGALAILLGANRSSLGLRMPARRYVRWAVVGFLVTGPIALLVGPLVAEPFVGPVRYDVTIVGAILPALVFATANGVLEEVIYRGALLGWSARVMGVGPALIGQAVVFGLAHSGPDIVGMPIPLMLALGVGGLVAGAITVRTRSLLIPIAIHIGLDIPLYYGLACAT